MLENAACAACHLSLVVNDALRGARIKLERANLHSGIARREARRFFQRHPEPTFAIEPHGELSDFKVGSVFGCKVVVREGWPDLPGSFASRFGDAIHNYRCVADHVAWQLVCHGATPPNTLSDHTRRAVQFPVYDSEVSFDKNISRRLPGADQAAIDFIRAHHRYVGGSATNDALLTLARLSNDDKHRTLTFITSAIVNVQTQIAFVGCELVTVRNPAAVPAVKAGAVTMVLECRVTGPNPAVRGELRPTMHIALEDGRGFGDVLAEIQREITHVIDAPEILAAVSVARARRIPPAPEVARPRHYRLG
jgi:hypothetical protein